MGSGIDQRRSKRIVIDTIYFKGLIYANSTNYACTVPVHFWLVSDRSPGSTNPAVSDMFTASDNSYTYPETYIRNALNRNRFTVVKHFKYTLKMNGLRESGTVTAGTPTSVLRAEIDRLVRVKSVTQYNDDPSGTIDNIEFGALYWIAMSPVVNVKASMVRNMYFRNIA